VRTPLDSTHLESQAVPEKQVPQLEPEKAKEVNRLTHLLNWCARWQTSQLVFVYAVTLFLCGLIGALLVRLATVQQAAEYWHSIVVGK